MKLLMCLDCADIFNLTFSVKKCTCGKTSGKYTDELNAEIKGNCKAIGFANNSFVNAYKTQQMEDNAQTQANKETCCNGAEFKAFFIPSTATSIKRI